MSNLETESHLPGELAMSLDGHVENGVVVFNEPVALPNGTPVRVEILTDPKATRPQSGAAPGHFLIITSKSSARSTICRPTRQRIMTIICMAHQKMPNQRCRESCSQ